MGAWNIFTKRQSLFQFTDILRFSLLFVSLSRHHSSKVFYHCHTTQSVSWLLPYFTVLTRIVRRNLCEMPACTNNCKDIIFMEKEGFIGQGLLWFLTYAWRNYYTWFIFPRNVEQFKSVSLTRTEINCPSLNSSHFILWWNGLFQIYCNYEQSSSFGAMVGCIVQYLPPRIRRSIDHTLDSASRRGK